MGSEKSTKMIDDLPQLKLLNQQSLFCLFGLSVCLFERLVRKSETLKFGIKQGDEG